MLKTTGQTGERLFTSNYVLLLTANFAGFAGFYFLLPVLPPYVLSLGGSESQVGLISGILAITSVLARPFWGHEVDRRGKKRLLLWGSLAITVIMASYHLAYAVAALVVIRLVHGAAWAATTTSSSAMVADLAPASRRGEAMGYFGTASSMALAVAPLAAVALVGSYGFNHLFWAATGAVFIALVITWRIQEVSRPLLAEVGRAEAQACIGPGWLSLVYRPALLPSFTAFTMTLTYGGMATYVALLALRHDVNPGLFFAVYAILLILSRPIGGRIADRAGRRACIIPGMAMLALGLGFMAFATDLPHFLVAGALYGVGFGFVSPSLMALTADLAAPEARGAAMATYTSAFDLGIGVGAILLGFLLERTSFEVMYLTSAGIAVVSLVIYTAWSGKR